MSANAKNRTFVIGSFDCYNSVEDLVAAYESLQSGKPTMGDIMVFRYYVPPGVSDDIALMMGQAHAFDNDWTRAGTISFCPEDEI